ncbi:MAG: protein translocase subunit SecD [bacterium]
MKNIRSPKTILVIILLLTIMSGFFIVPGFIGAKYSPWRLGLDLVGGSVLVYNVDLTGIPESEYSSTLEGLHGVIESRINKYGVAEPRITVAQQNGEYQLLVELAGIKDLKDAVREIGETPSLDFRETLKMETEQGESVAVWQRTELTGRHIAKAQIGFDQASNNQPVVQLEFDEEGAKIFEQLTEKNIDKPIGIFVDGELFEAPSPREKISGGKAVISGGSQGFTLDQANQLVGRLNAGALSAPITLINQRTVSASAAEGALYAIIYAGFIGTLLVMLFMILHYRFFGLFASFALLIYIILTLGIFKSLPNFTMTLAGIAGFILSIGIAVDANILIFERMKEEMKKGLSKTAAMEMGFKRAWTSIRDSDIATIICAVILYYFTTSFMRGFALTLGIGVALSMISAVFVTKQMLKMFIKNG